MGPAVNLTRGWRKTIWPDWKPPGPPGKKMFELKKLTRCASAPSQQGVGQALTSLEPQICHGRLPEQLDGAGYRSFFGAAAPPGAGGALFDGFAPPSLDPDE